MSSPQDVSDVCFSHSGHSLAVATLGGSVSICSVAADAGTGALAASVVHTFAPFANDSDDDNGSNDSANAKAAAGVRHVAFLARSDSVLLCVDANGASLATYVRPLALRAHYRALAWGVAPHTAHETAWPQLHAASLGGDSVEVDFAKANADDAPQCAGRLTLPNVKSQVSAGRLAAESESNHELQQ